MTDMKEQHFCIRVYIKLGKNGSEIFKMLEGTFREQKSGKNTSF
jgi:hypothetical protein